MPSNKKLPDFSILVDAQSVLKQLRNKAFQLPILYNKLDKHEHNDILQSVSIKTADTKLSNERFISAVSLISSVLNDHYVLNESSGIAVSLNNENDNVFTITARYFSPSLDNTLTPLAKILEDSLESKMKNWVKNFFLNWEQVSRNDLAIEKLVQRSIEKNKYGFFANHVDQIEKMCKQFIKDFSFDRSFIRDDGVMVNIPKAKLEQAKQFFLEELAADLSLKNVEAAATLKKINLGPSPKGIVQAAIPLALTKELALAIRLATLKAPTPSSNFNTTISAKMFSKTKPTAKITTTQTPTNISSKPDAANIKSKGLEIKIKSFLCK